MEQPRAVASCPAGSAAGSEVPRLIVRCRSGNDLGIASGRPTSQPGHAGQRHVGVPFVRRCGRRPVTEPADPRRTCRGGTEREDPRRRCTAAGCIEPEDPRRKGPSDPEREDPRRRCAGGPSNEAQSGTPRSAIYACNPCDVLSSAAAIGRRTETGFAGGCEAGLSALGWRHGRHRRLVMQRRRKMVRRARAGPGRCSPHS